MHCGFVVTPNPLSQAIPPHQTIKHWRKKVTLQLLPFNPDITAMVDWALQISYLSVHSCCGFKPRKYKDTHLVFTVNFDTTRLSADSVFLPHDWLKKGLAMAGKPLTDCYRSCEGTEGNARLLKSMKVRSDACLVPLSLSVIGRRVVTVTATPAGGSLTGMWGQS